MDEVKEENLVELVGFERYKLFLSLRDCVSGLYSAEKQWNRGGKKWDYEYKYRMGAKTLCGFYFRKDCVGFMVILGRTEQAAFEQKLEPNSLCQSKVPMMHQKHIMTACG